MRPVFRIPALRFPIMGDIVLPGSKSQANRAIVCAALARGKTVIRNATACDDVKVMVQNLQKLGFDLEWIDLDAGTLEVHGGIPTKPGKDTLDCHNAGTTLRFLTSLACLVPGEWTLTGNSHMLRRPIHDLLSALRTLGASIEDTNGGLPITVHGGSVRGGSVSLKADISSQYLTSLLLIAPALTEGISVELSGPLASSGYIELTRRVMSDFGCFVTPKDHGFFVAGSPYHSLVSYEIEGDWSGAGAWLVLEAISGSTFHLTNVSRTSEQSDRHLPGIIATLLKEGDREVSCKDIPDQLMNLSVLAAFRRGTTRFTGARNLRHKECDRLHVISTELKKAGVDITEEEDGVFVRGTWNKHATRSKHQRPALTLDPHDDHRMAMCFAILGLFHGSLSLKQADCVQKSYPRFYDDLHRLLSTPKPIAIVGMRGAGKSSLARRFARTLKLAHIDSDHAFVDRHGPIKDYVAKFGWRAFREEEAKIVLECIRPGVVLSCGGGSIESPSVRRALREQTIGVWLHAKKSVLMERLKSGKRPPLTNLPLTQEVDTLLQERSPHYKEVSKIEIPASVSFSKQTEYVREKLQEYLVSYDLHSQMFQASCSS